MPAMKRTPTAPSSRIYPNLKATKPEETKRPPPIEGWAKQRKEWGEDDYHRARGPVSPLGGQVKRGK
jgi:hypothetical protein